MAAVQKHNFFLLVSRTHDVFVIKFLYILSLKVINITTLYLSGTSKDKGESGGIGYESLTVSLPDTHFSGFCLTCRFQ